VLEALGLVLEIAAQLIEGLDRPIPITCVIVAGSASGGPSTSGRN
jgi:hypothetical protein